jgi:anaerobic selenocysteine-containing dehydrogenase
VAQLHELAPALARRPGGLVLVNRRLAQQYNSLHREVEGRGRPAEPSLLVHPADAEPVGLATGDVAELRTPTGSCRAVVVVTSAIRPGVVSLPHGFDTANVNTVVSTDHADPLSGMTVTSGLEVELRRVPQPA